jgi:hypothetical protein
MLGLTFLARTVVERADSQRRKQLEAYCGLYILFSLKDALNTSFRQPTGNIQIPLPEINPACRV